MLEPDPALVESVEHLDAWSRMTHSLGTKDGDSGASTCWSITRALPSSVPREASPTPRGERGACRCARRGHRHPGRDRPPYAFRAVPRLVPCRPCPGAWGPEQNAPLGPEPLVWLVAGRSNALPCCYPTTIASRLSQLTLLQSLRVPDKACRCGSDRQPKGWPTQPRHAPVIFIRFNTLSCFKTLQGSP